MKTKLITRILSAIDDPFISHDVLTKLRAAGQRLSLGFSTYGEAQEFVNSFLPILERSER